MCGGILFFLNVTDIDMHVHYHTYQSTLGSTTHALIFIIVDSHTLILVHI